MKVFEQLKQRSKEWFEKRNGIVTGTEVKKLFGKPATMEDYAYEIAAQKMSTQREDLNEVAMVRGTRLEPNLFEAFEKETGLKTFDVGFIQKDDEDSLFGFSPDRMLSIDVEYDAGLEGKCLSAGKHLKAWLTGEIPAEGTSPKGYHYQCVHYFFNNPVMKKLYFVLFNPEFTPKPLVILEFERSYFAKDLELLDLKAIDFGVKVDMITKAVEAKNG